MTVTLKSTFFSFCMIIGLMFSATISRADEQSKPLSPTLSKARSLMDRQDYKSAIKLLTKARKNGEDTVEISLLLAEAYGGRIDQVGTLKKMGLAKKLRKNLEHALDLDPDNLDVLQGLVMFHMQAPSVVGGDREKARELTTKITEKAPLRGHLLAAQLASAQKDYKGARAELAQAKSIAPDKIDVWVGLGLVDMAQKHYDAAIRNFEHCLKIAPDHIDCHYMIGKAADLGKTASQKGKTALQKVIELEPKDKEYLAYAHFRLGNLERAGGDEAAARIHYQKAIEIANIEPARKALQNPGK